MEVELAFRDRSAIKDDGSNNAQVVDRGTFSRMRTESTVLRTMNSLNNCDHVSCRKIYKRSYKSGTLTVTGSLTTGLGGTSSLASSAERSTEVSTRGSLISSSAHQQLLTALSDSTSCSNSITNSDPGSSRTPGSTRTGRLWICVHLCILAYYKSL